MEKSLLAAVSGIEANQTYLDVVGNNVANANTTAYKAQSADFTDLLAEQISGASAPLPNGQGAGINPIAVGSGVRIGSVSNDQSQGALVQTNAPTDVAIQGAGFLVAVQNGQTLYTRAGNLTLDANGNLATQSGGLIQGWTANAKGVVNSNAPIGPVAIPAGTTMGAQPTTTFTLGGNLPVWAGTGTAPTPVTQTVNAYDSLGNSIPVTFTFTPVDSNPQVATNAGQWTMQANVPTPGTPGSTTPLWTTAPTVVFDTTSGQIKSVGGTSITTGNSLPVSVPTPTGYDFPTGTNWTITFPAANGTSSVTQYAAPSTLSATPDGFASGTLAGFSIGGDGVITGSFTNGKNLPIGQLAMAIFSNPGGLADQGSQMYASSPNSGQANVGTPSTGGRGNLVGGSLESSNVDLANQLTDLIIAQEAYQANTKVISTTSMNLQALTQMA